MLDLGAEQILRDGSRRIANGCCLLDEMLDLGRLVKRVIACLDACLGCREPRARLLIGYCAV